jgi:hypothetical protein
MNKPQTHTGDLEGLRQLPGFADLILQKRWVTWKWEWRADKNGGGKWTKPPFQAHGLALARSDDPATWGTFDMACDSVRKGRADGIGVMLLGSEIAAADLDHCRDPATGIIETWAEGLIQQCEGAYSEVTVSGTGLRIIGRACGGRVQRKLNGSNGSAVELYRNCERYITVSAYQAISASDLPNIDDFIDDLVAKFDAAKEREASARVIIDIVNGQVVIDLNLAGPQQGEAQVDYEDVIENGAPNGQRSDAFNAAVWSLAAQGLSLEQIFDRLSQNPGGIAKKYLDQGGTARLRQETIRCYDKWRTARQAAAQGAPQPGGARGRPAPPASPGGAPGIATGGMTQPWPQIIINAGERARVINEAEDALLALSGQRKTYQRGQQVVRPAIVRLKAADGEWTEVWRLLPIQSGWLSETFECAAQFVSIVGHGGRRITNCPKWVADIYLERAGMWRLPYLKGVITSPILRPDGSILDQPGYDEQTGLLYRPDIEFPSMPLNPSKQDALEALLFLKHSISTFPFVTPADEAVGLSAFLTVQHKRSLAAAPLHGFSAQSRTGKTKFVEGASIMVNGQKMAVGSPSGEEEFYKYLGAALRSGSDIICLDNWDRPLESALLCQILTQEAIDYRVFVRNAMERIPTGAMIFATGVNLTFKGDLKGRSLRAKMDANQEDPQKRKFHDNFTDMVKKYRGQFVLAVLTILRAWQLAQSEGETTGVEPFGGFELWSSQVREALIWLGEADPCDTVEAINADDPERARLVAVMTFWEQILGVSSITGGKAFTSGDLIYEAERVRVSVPGFYDALCEAAGIGAQVTSKMLTGWLNAKGRDIVIGERKIIQAGSRVGTMTWKLVKV